MSFEPDTNDIRLRQLAEEIKKIREEQFAKAFPVGLGGGSSPVGGDAVTGGSSTGTFSWLPNMVRVTRDTGVVERLAYKNKNVNKDFFIGDIVDGVTSGASGEIGDIDITGTDTGFLIFVPGTTSGTFIDSENLDATTDGNNIAEADLSLANPVGRGHLNAGSASIIAEATESPAEIHFIDTAQQNGQLAFLRAQNGQTIRMRRAVTNDGNTGNLDLDESFNITENALVLFQFQRQSNVTPDGGWVPLISDVVTTGVGAGGGINFPILYPQTNLGSVGLQTVALNLNNANGHYQLMTLTGDISLAFVNETSVGVGFKFYAVLAQDAVGGHALISVPASVKNGSALVAQLDQTALSQTLFQFTTADGGVTYHAQLVSPVSAGQNQTPWLQDVDANTFDLFRLDKLRFFGAGGFSFPTDATIQGLSTSGTGLQFNVPINQTYRFFFGGVECIQLTFNDFFFFDRNLKDVGSIFFTDSVTFDAQIFPIPAFAELSYNVAGAGSHHAFFADNPLNPVFEMRANVNKSNVNFDLVTNNMINTDQILFIDSQGFNNATDHAERRLTGGSTGINMNLPVISPFQSEFAIWFEEDTLDRSNVYYKFQRGQLIMGTGVGDCTRAPVVTGAIQYQLCRGGGIFDFGFKMSLESGDSGNQDLEISVGNSIVQASNKKVVFVNGEDGPAGQGGGMKMFTDLNMQTHNINNIDVAVWETDVGTGAGGLGNNAYGIVADDTESLTLGTVPGGVNRPIFLFHAPRDVIATDDPMFAWGKRHEVFATLDEGDFHMYANNINLKSLIISDGGFGYGLAYQPIDNPAIDGRSRLINNSGSLDVVYRTGGELVNLSDLVGVGEGANKKLSNLDPLTEINSDLVPESDGLLNLGSPLLSWNDINADRMIFRHNNGVVCGVPSIGRSSNALRLNSPLGNGITLEENCVPLYDFGVSPKGLTLQNGALFVNIQGVSTLQGIANFGSSMLFSNSANLANRSFDFGDPFQTGERVNIFGSGDTFTELRFKTDMDFAIRDVGRIVFEGHSDTGSDVDYSRLDGRTAVTTNANESGIGNWRVAESGNQNQAYISINGFFEEIQMHRYTDFNQEVEFDADVFHDASKIFLDFDRNSFLQAPIDNVMILTLFGAPEYIWTNTGFDITDKFLQLTESPGGGTPPSTSGRIFLNDDDGILYIKKDQGQIISLEAGGGGQNQTPWLTDINANGFGLDDIDRISGRNTGQQGSFQIIFDAGGDSDTFIGTGSNADEILFRMNGGNAMRMNPAQGMRFGSTGGGDKFFIDMVKNYIRFDSEDPSQIPTPDPTEVHLWFDQVTDELSVKHEDGSIVSLESAFGGNIQTDLIPDPTCTHDLGSASQKWKDIYHCGTIFGGGAQFLQSVSVGFGAFFSAWNTQINGDFNTRGLETVLGNGTNDNLRIIAQIRRNLLFGAFNQFATGPVAGIERSGEILCEELFLKFLNPDFPDFELPAGQFGPVVRCATTARHRAGYYTKPLALITGTPHGTAGTVQLPQRETGYSGDSASADLLFHGDGGCIGIENTNRFPNTDPKLIVRDNLGNWYECPLTLLHSAPP